jgi:mannose-6-phosphate isomerase-like protein (cupin superfamily)
MISTVVLEEKIKEINQPWTPVDIAVVNDYVVRLALFDGRYHWHLHENEDELFYVVKGRIVIQLKNQADIVLEKGQMSTIPKGVEHCPKSIEPSYVLMFEPFKLISKGQ